jgi:MFS family permease
MTHLTSQTQARRGTAAAMGLIAIGFAGSTMITPLYALYQAQFGFSAVMLTIVYAAYVIGNLSALLFLGRLSDRIGRRPIAFAAITLCLIAALVFLTAHGTAWLFAGRVVSGLAVGLASGTGTAWLVDLRPEDRPRATLLAIQANMAGIGLGPPLPLALPFLVYGAAIATVAVMVARTRETVSTRAIDAALFRPQFALPQDACAAFVAPAITSFATFAFVGFYAALLPSILRQAMHLASPAIGGAILAQLFAVAAATMLATRRLSSRTAMLSGLVTIAPALALLVLAQSQQSLALLMLGTTSGGIALALGYRGSLEIVNTIAPADRRAGLVSVYLVICFIGNSLPVIGVAMVGAVAGPVRASEIFAGMMLVLAAFAFITGLRFAPRRPTRACEAR